jgi:hypothetical protein
VPVEQVRDPAERQREPEHQQPVCERRHDGLVRGRPGERQEPCEPGLDEAEPPGVKGISVSSIEPE